jgi:hypothetical protein
MFQIVARETSQNLADPIELAKLFNQTKASPLWVQVSVLALLLLVGIVTFSQPFQTDALGKKNIVRFYWGRTVLDLHDTRNATATPDADMSSSDAVSSPLAQATSEPSKHSSFFTMIGGLQAAFTAITSAVASGVTIVSGSPSKRTKIETDVSSPARCDEPSKPALSHAFIPATKHATLASPQKCDSLPEKRLLPPGSSFAPSTRYPKCQCCVQCNSSSVFITRMQQPLEAIWRGIRAADAG